jgi:hypothetical protein
MNIEGLNKIFNVNKSTFYGFDEEGRIQARGRFISEFDIAEFSDIKACYLVGFKKKNLAELVDLFPNILEITMEKSSQLVSLEGLQKLTELRKIVLHNLPKLTDLSALKFNENLTDLDSAQFKNKVNLLSFLSKDNLMKLSINDTVTDLEEVSNFTNLSSLRLHGWDSPRTSLPNLPKLNKNLGITGFPNLTDASFMTNLDSTIYINWQGPKNISNIPSHLKSKF